jgi:hypothetical protein
MNRNLTNFISGIMLALCVLASDVFFILLLIILIVEYSLFTNNRNRFFARTVGIAMVMFIFFFVLISKNLFNDWITHTKITSVILQGSNLIEVFLFFLKNFFKLSIKNIFIEPYRIIGIVSILFSFLMILKSLKINKKLNTKEEIFLLINISSIFFYYTMLHRDNLYRFATGPAIGVISIFYYIDKIKEVNIKTSKSTNYAILVLHEHHKDKAREFFRSPLIFTVQEAKGLEYDNIIIYNFVSDEKNYTDITKGADRSFLDADFKYARVKDKTDKSLEIYKFYINALYVAITRSVCNVYIIESNPSHKFLRLLEINEIQEINIEASESSREDWQKEANKLIMQGKDEQAKAIETTILQHQNITWTPIDQDEFKHLYEKVISQKTADKRECIKLLNYSIIYSDLALIKQLQIGGLKAATNISKCIPLMLDEYFNDYLYQSTTNLLKKIDLVC